MQRKTALALLLVLLVGAGFGGTWWFLHSPHGSLYQIGKAIHDRDAGLFLTYVDVGRILAGSKDELLEAVLPDQVKQDQRNVLKQLLGAFMAPLTDQLKQRVVRLVSDKERDNIPTSWTLVWAAKVSRNGDMALATLEDLSEDRRMRIGLQQGDDGYWRVVEVNAQDLKELLADYLKLKQRPAAQPSSQPAN